jgi:hypothetical protein
MQAQFLSLTNMFGYSMICHLATRFKSIDEFVKGYKHVKEISEKQKVINFEKGNSRLD